MGVLITWVSKAPCEIPKSREKPAPVCPVTQLPEKALLSLRTESAAPLLQSLAVQRHGLESQSQSKDRLDGLICQLHRSCHHFLHCIPRCPLVRDLFSPSSSMTLMKGLRYCKQQAMNMVPGIRKERGECPTTYSF